MTDNTALFVGSIPENYERYLGPLWFEPYAEDLVRRLAIEPGDAVLELACGTGIVTTRLVRALPLGASLTATDFNQPMIDIARAKVDPSEPVTWQTADACSLPFGDEWFNTVVCQFGLMFFRDKLAALREARRVLQPGGVIHLNTWNSLSNNPIPSIVNDVVTTFFPVDPPLFYLVPYGMPDVAATRALLAEAGFESIASDTVDLVAQSDSASDAATGVVLGNPIATSIEERDPGAIARVRDSVAAQLRAAGGDNPMRLPMSAHVFTARRP